jgi:Flp pilus assembly protein TadG
MMMKLREKTGQRGMAAVEFGLVLPIVCVLIFATFEFGMAFWRKQSLTAAVREGARKMIVATNPRKNFTSDVKPVVETYMDGVGLTDTARTVTSSSATCGASGTSLTVTATYPTNFIILSRFLAGFPSAKTITSTITMQCE